jgi:hypothetical protein
VQQAVDFRFFLDEIEWNRKSAACNPVFIPWRAFSPAFSAAAIPQPVE